MANAPKQGLDYFPLSVDFLDDIKVRKILRACGAQSVSVLISLLSRIYRFEGYFVVWDADVRFLVADHVGAKESLVQEIVQKALDVEFFDAQIFETKSILTSRGIQMRFFDTVARLRRKEIRYDATLMLISINDSDNWIDVSIDPINDVKNEQRKGKEKKGKERRGEERERAPEPPPSGHPSTQTVIDAWNALNLQPLRSINAGTNRYALLQARIKEYSLQDVLEAIESIGHSGFLKGQNKNGWTITFDWFVRPNNFLKVLEGNYLDRDPQARPAYSNTFLEIMYEEQQKEGSQ